MDSFQITPSLPPFLRLTHPQATNSVTPHATVSRAAPPPSVALSSPFRRHRWPILRADDTGTRGGRSGSVTRRGREFVRSHLAGGAARTTREAQTGALARPGSPRRPAALSNTSAAIMTCLLHTGRARRPGTCRRVWQAELFPSRSRETPTAALVKNVSAQISRYRGRHC